MALLGLRNILLIILKFPNESKKMPSNLRKCIKISDPNSLPRKSQIGLPEVTTVNRTLTFFSPWRS